MILHKEEIKNLKTLLSDIEIEFERDLISDHRDQLRKTLNLYDRSSHFPDTEMLGCNINKFKTFIESKMTSNMNWDNIDLYHIKPILSFNLMDYHEVCDCSHYTNYQPLLFNEKIDESWTEEDDRFWKENIRGNDSYREIYYK